MKAYQKKSVFSLSVITAGLYLTINSLDFWKSMKPYIGEWSVIPYFISCASGVILLVVGFIYLYETIFKKKGDGETPWELLKEKLYEGSIPVLRWADQFMDWLNTDSPKK